MASRKTCGQILPRSLAGLFRRARFAAIDAIDRCRGRADEMTPPRWLQAFVGGGDFRAAGEEFSAHFPPSRPLAAQRDACSTSAAASGGWRSPCWTTSAPEGRYVGFDISPQAIRWCTDHFAAKNARFTFHVADIFNKEYNPRGTGRAAEYRFPCEDASIDFAFAASVFTHMLPDDVRRYLAEIHRVLKPGGRGLFTHFILNGESAAAISPAGGDLRFLHSLGECRTIDADVPERAIAYEEAVLRRIYAEAGMRIEEPIRFARVVRPRRRPVLPGHRAGRQGGRMKPPRRVASRSLAGDGSRRLRSPRLRFSRIL